MLASWGQRKIGLCAPSHASGRSNRSATAFRFSDLGFLSRAAREFTTVSGRCCRFSLARSVRGAVQTQRSSGLSSAAGAGMCVSFLRRTFRSLSRDASLDLSSVGCSLERVDALQLSVLFSFLAAFGHVSCTSSPTSAVQCLVLVSSRGASTAEGKGPGCLLIVVFLGAMLCWMGWPHTDTWEVSLCSA